MDIQFFVVVLLVAIAVAWWSRGRFQRGSIARKVATGIAVLLSGLGLTVVGFAVFIIIAISSWANSK